MCTRSFARAYEAKIVCSSTGMRNAKTEESPKSRLLIPLPVIVRAAVKSQLYGPGLQAFC